MKFRPSFAAVLTIVSASYLAWQCWRGRHPEAKPLEMFCPKCGSPKDRERWERFMGHTPAEHRTTLAREIH